jgi:hypothetical protein
MLEVKTGYQPLPWKLTILLFQQYFVNQATTSAELFRPSVFE